jgi:hypothetical protein
MRIQESPPGKASESTACFWIEQKDFDHFTRTVHQLLKHSKKYASFNWRIDGIKGTENISSSVQASKTNSRWHWCSLKTLDGSQAEYSSTAEFLSLHASDKGTPNAHWKVNDHIADWPCRPSQRSLIDFSFPNANEAAADILRCPGYLIRGNATTDVKIHDPSRRIAQFLRQCQLHIMHKQCGSFFFRAYAIPEMGESPGWEGKNRHLAKNLIP